MSHTAENKKVLIVEDERPMREALCNKFKQEHFNVFEAKNGEEGLKVALQEHPDMILLDIIMPVMDGMAMLEKLRLDFWGKTANVIMLTNIDNKSNITEAMQKGVLQFLVKSDWKIEEVLHIVQEKLK